MSHCTESASWSWSKVESKWELMLASEVAVSCISCEEEHLHTSEVSEVVVLESKVGAMVVPEVPGNTVADSSCENLRLYLECSDSIAPKPLVFRNSVPQGRVPKSCFFLHAATATSPSASTSTTPVAALLSFNLAVSLSSRSRCFLFFSASRTALLSFNLAVSLSSFSRFFLALLAARAREDSCPNIEGQPVQQRTKHQNSKIRSSIAVATIPQSKSGDKSISPTGFMVLSR
ncbi:hypothetical protein BDZ45DRAFT_449543 [Acephala macrosclerotiorum]|nr:hypothetical protein BDZ45DRAFT_449543 [Acephala macrosclerotiorum]